MQFEHLNGTQSLKISQHEPILMYNQDNFHFLLKTHIREDEKFYQQRAPQE